MKVTVLNDNGEELYSASEGFLVAVDSSKNTTRVTLRCSTKQLAEFVSQLIGELHEAAQKDGMSDTEFLQNIAEMSNIVVRNGRSTQEAQ